MRASWFKVLGASPNGSLVSTSINSRARRPDEPRKLRPLCDVFAARAGLIAGLAENASRARTLRVETTRAGSAVREASFSAWPDPHEPEVSRFIRYVCLNCHVGSTCINSSAGSLGVQHPGEAAPRGTDDDQDRRRLAGDTANRSRLVPGAIPGCSPSSSTAKMITMILTTSLRSRHCSFRRHAGARAGAVRGGRRPVVELLECRQLLSIAVDTFDDVVNPNDGLTGLREAITQAAANAGADTVVLPHEIGGIVGTYALSLGELDIDDADPLTIQSDGGPATVDVQGASRVFTVAAGSVVTLEGLVITGGSVPDADTGSGGGVLNDGTITIADCTFLDNSAGFAGGGLYNTGQATVCDSTFQGNASTYGGGFANVGTASVSGGVFSNNTASGNSGGLDNIGIVSVTGTLFESNTAALYGGAVNVYGGFVGFPGTTSLDGCTFLDNTSAYTAGGVQISDTTGTVSNCIFQGNSAVYGGGLSTSGATTVTNCDFNSNTATGNGGGIDNVGTISVTGSTFEGNTASDGGGIHSYGGSTGYPGSLTVDDSTIDGNSASSGGGISLEQATASITDSNISSNTAASIGGGIYGYSDALTLSDVVLQSNLSLYSSGGGLANSYGSVAVSDSTIAGNSANNGGGVYNYYGTISVIGVAFTGNSAAFAGGGLYNDYGTTATVTSSTFTSNSANYAGGMCNLYATTTITDVAFESNVANYTGGGLYNDYGSTTTVTGSTFENNVAVGSSGGGLVNYYGTATVTGSTFKNNSADLSDGGGLANFYGTATISANTFDSNSAFDGGGLYSLYGAATVTDNIITANQGGGISLAGYSSLVQGNAITGNTGDGVRIEGGYYNMIGTPDAGNTITGNTGAGVAVLSDATGNMIRGNVINSNGGLAIDLGDDGRTANDPGDADSGANNLQNFPIITGFVTGATTRITGTLSSTPNSTFTVDVYADSALNAAVNPGESHRYLASFTVTTDALGNASFDQTLAAATTADEIPTATATDAFGNTSEFSFLVPIQVTPTTGLFTSESGSKASFNVVLTLKPTSNVTIPLFSSDTTEGTVSPASLTFTPANWNVPKVVTVTGVDDAIADGPIAYTIVTGPATSTDTRFSGKDPADVQVTNFDNDFAPLAAIQPLGSLIHDGILEGHAAAGGSTEKYSLVIDAGQTITVVVEPEGTDLKPTIQLIQAGSGLVLATATAGAAGQDAVVQTVATQAPLGTNGPGPWTYQIRVSGASGTAGLFHVRIILNAAVENESYGGRANDTRLAAQSLEPSFLLLSGAPPSLLTGLLPGRGAVLGRTDGSTPDYYAFSLSAGQSATVVLTSLSSGDPILRWKTWPALPWR